MDFEKRIEEYSVRPGLIVGTLKSDLDKNLLREKTNNSYLLKPLEEIYKDQEIVPYMRDWHGLFLRLRIAIRIDEEIIYHCLLEKPVLSKLKNLLSHEDYLKIWFAMLNKESQDFINEHHKMLKMEYPFVFRQPRADEVDFLVAQILKENRP